MRQPAAAMCSKSYIRSGCTQAVLHWSRIKMVDICVNGDRCLCPCASLRARLFDHLEASMGATVYCVNLIAKRMCPPPILSSPTFVAPFRRLRVHAVFVRLPAVRRRAGSAVGHAVRRPSLDMAVSCLQSPQGYLYRANENDRGFRGESTVRIRGELNDIGAEEPAHLRQPRSLLCVVPCGVSTRINICT